MGSMHMGALVGKEKRVLKNNKRQGGGGLGRLAVVATCDAKVHARRFALLPSF
jgi:hypothetical protein